jgi:hypothetical protein
MQKVLQRFLVHSIGVVNTSLTAVLGRYIPPECPGVALLYDKVILTALGALGFPVPKDGNHFDTKCVPARSCGAYGMCSPRTPGLMAVGCVACHVQMDRVLAGANSCRSQVPTPPCWPSGPQHPRSCVRCYLEQQRCLRTFFYHAHTVTTASMRAVP